MNWLMKDKHRVVPARRYKGIDSPGHVGES